MGIWGAIGTAASTMNDDKEMQARFDQPNQDRRALAHEELEAKSKMILDDVKRLQDRRQNLDPKSATYGKDVSGIDASLKQHQQAFTDLYHPEKNPGHLQHLGGILKRHRASQQQPASPNMSVPVGTGPPVSVPRPVPKTPAEAKQRMGTWGKVGEAASTMSGDQPRASMAELQSGAAGTGTSPENKFVVLKQQIKEALPNISDEDVDKAVRIAANLEAKPGTVKPPKPLKYDAATDQVIDENSGTRYPRGAKDAPPEVQQMFSGAEAMAVKKQKNAIDLANVRGASYGMNRPISVLDAANGNAPTEVTMADIKKQPGRYQPAGPAMTALTQENLMQDIAGTSSQARDAITNLKDDFPPEMRTKLAVALRDNDPGGAVGQLISSGALGSLTEDQQDFVIAINQLTENAMAMRSVLKTGAGAEDIRSAIRSTLPGVLSPDKSFALRQLDAFDKTLARLHRGVPRVNLPEQGPGALRSKAKELAGRGGTRAFTLNGESYDIPADKVEEFKKKHPEAEEEQ